MRSQEPTFRVRSVLLRAGLGLAALLPAAGAGAQDAKGKVSMERVEYKGWKNNARISNGRVELIVTLDVGPRILSYRRGDGKNVLKEFDDQLGKSGESEWRIRGGHRIWAAPEQSARTYAPDNGPVQVAETGPRTWRFTPAPETQYGLQKELEVTLEAIGSEVTVTNRIRNVGQAPTDLAPWALTVMAPGGLEIIPLPPKKPHPSQAKAPTTDADFLPNQQLSVWPYFDFKDKRWSFGSRYVTLRQTDGDPTKLGLAHTVGWVGYLNDGNLFVKRFPYQAGQPYPDGGVNYETFTQTGMLEMESLGPLVRLAPGQQVDLVERWTLHVDQGKAESEDELDALVKQAGIGGH